MSAVMDVSGQHIGRSGCRGQVKALHVRQPPDYAISIIFCHLKATSDISCEQDLLSPL